MLVIQSCLTLCNYLDCRLPGSSVHGILQAKLLAWAAVPFSWISSWPRDQTWVSCIADRFFTIWTTREEIWIGRLLNKKWSIEKTGLKLNIQKAKIIAFCPIISWQIEGEKAEDLFSWAPKSPWMVIEVTKLKEPWFLGGKLWQS